MLTLNDLYKLFDESVKRSKESYKPKTEKVTDKRTARSSSLNHALNNIQNQLRGIQ